jgi:hypothetical protein
VSPGAADTEWPCGHHSEVRVAQTSNAWSGEHATVNLSSSGSNQRSVFSAAIRNRAAASPHTCSR